MVKFCSSFWERERIEDAREASPVAGKLGTNYSFRASRQVALPNFQLSQLFTISIAF